MIGTGGLRIRLPGEQRYKGIAWAVVAAVPYFFALSPASINAGTEFGNWPAIWELPIQQPIESAFEWFAGTFAWFFNPVSEVIDAALAGIDTFLLWLPWPCL